MKRNIFVFGFAVFLYASFGISTLVRETGLQRFGILSHVAVLAVLLVIALFFVPSRLPEDPPRLAALGVSALLCLATTMFPVPWMLARFAPPAALMLVLQLALVAALVAYLMAVPPPAPKPQSRPAPQPQPQTTPRPLS